MDDYANNTLDTVSALKVLNEELRLTPPDFCVIADDDSYVNIARLWRELFRTNWFLSRFDKVRASMSVLGGSSKVQTLSLMF